MERKMKWKLLMLALMSALFMGTTNVYASEIGMSASKVKINVGDTYDLDVTGTDATPYWTSWNINKVRVNQEGVVTGVRTGTVTVSARVGLTTKKCSVIVVKPTIKLNKKEATIYTGAEDPVRTLQLKATAKGASKSILWTSSDTEIATVDANGKVTSVSAGTAVITATANGESASCVVTVKDNAISLNMDTMQLSTKGNGSSIKLIPTVVGSKKSVKWTTSDKTIATVSGGKVTGKKSGTATITAKANGVSASCTVNVVSGSISINTEKEQLYVGETKKLKTNAGKKDVVTWETSDTEVVFVDEKGEMKAVGAGKAVITASCNGTTDNCEIVVSDTKTRIGEDAIELKTKGVDKTHQLGLKIIGRKTSVKWTSADKKIATVSGKGKVTAKKEGTTTITATANGVTDSVVVTVKEYNPSITLNEEEYILYTNKGNKVTLKAKVDGKNKKVVWSSSEPSVATVINGKVTALCEGQTVISATANGVTEDCLITVKESKVLLDKYSVLMEKDAKTELPTDIIGTSQKATYKSTNSKVVTVKNGVLTAKNYGEADIKVTANGVTAICHVSVDACVHTYGEGQQTKAPTCKEEGILSLVCTKCSKEQKEAIPVTEHKWTEIKRIPAGCTVDGTVVFACSDCGTTRQEIIPETGHIYGDWIVITSPSDFTQGIEKQYCNVCGHEKTNVKPPVIHEDWEGDSEPESVSVQIVSAPQLVEKNSAFEVKLKVVETIEDNVTDVEVNDNWIAAEADENGSITLSFTSASTACKTTYNITGVRIGEEEYPVEQSVTVETEKDMPSINPTSFSLRETLLSFIVKNVDASFLQGEVIVSNKATGTEVETVSCYSGINMITLTKIKPNTEYIVKIVLTYKLDDAGEHIKQNIEERTVSYQAEEVEILTRINNYNDNTVLFMPGEEATLYFELNQTLESDVSAITINGTDYAVEKDGTKYKFNYTMPTVLGSHDLTLTKLILANGEILTADKTSTMRIVGETPSASEIEVSLKEDSKYEHIAKVTIVDKDNSLFENENPTLCILKDNHLYKTYDLVVGENTVDLGLDLEPETSYRFEVRVSYDNGSGINKKNTAIRKQDIISCSKVTDEIEITGFKLSGEDGEEKEVYSHKEKITVELYVEEPKFTPDKIEINENEIIPVTVGDKKIIFPYELTDATDVTLKITNTWVGSKEVPIKGENYSIEIPVQKIEPEVRYIGTVDSVAVDNITFKININDPDNALSKLKIEFYKLIGDTEEFIEQVDVNHTGTDTKEVSFARTEESDYRLKVWFNATLSLDNSYENKLAYTKDIHISTASVDLKDIESYTLYDKGVAVEGLEVTEELLSGTELNSYFLEIQPVYAPKLYTGVKEFKQVDGKLYAVADLDEFLTFKEINDELVAENSVTFEIKVVENGEVKGLKSADELVNAIKADLTGTYRLEEDLDASKVSTSDATLITGTFTGKLYGDGHTIYGLNKPMFNEISGGLVENITFADGEVSNAVGFLALKMKDNTNVEGVNFKNCSLLTNAAGVGLVAGGFTSSTASDISVLDCTITGNNTVGAAIGEIGAGSLAEKCFVWNTTVKGTLSHGMGSRVGGVTGWLNNNGTIKNSFVSAAIQSVGDYGAGGLVGGSSSTGGTIKDSFATTTGQGYTLSGYNSELSKVTNFYQLESATNKNTASGIIDIPEITKELITESIGLSEECFNIIEESRSALGSGTNLAEISTYKKEYEQRYVNIMKIAPFLNTESVIQMGNFLTNENLKTKKVMGVYAFDADNNHVEYLSKGNEDVIKTIKIAYTDGAFDTFHVNYLKSPDGIVAVYNVAEDSIPYHFNGYIVDDNGNLAEYIAEEAGKLDFDEDIETVALGSNKDHRLYNVVFNDYIKNELDTVAEKLVAARYAYSLENNYLVEKLKADAKEELANFLYIYTYFRKNMGFEIGGVNPAEVVLFEPHNLSNEIDLDYLSESLRNRDTHTAYSYTTINDVVTSKMGMSLYPYFEMLIRMSGATDYNDWFIENWDGYVVEKEPTGYDYSNKLKWRIWDNLTSFTDAIKDRDAHLLHILTIPKELQPQIGIITTSSQLMFTECNKYYWEPTEENLQKFYNKLENFANYLGVYYGTSLNFVENGEENLNLELCIVYESIMNYNCHVAQGTQTAGSETPLVKWIFEPVGKSGPNSAGAVSNGTYTQFGYMSLLDGFSTFTHENAHSQDADYFYGGLRRREPNHGEYHADGFLAMSVEVKYMDGEYAMNCVRDFDITDNVITNTKNSRIAGKELIWDYYRDFYDVWYATNAMYGYAFIDSSDSVKANVGKLASFEDNGSSGVAVYAQPDLDHYNNLKLRTLEDLYDNGIAIRVAERAEGAGYYEEPYWYVGFWAPSNPDGYADPGTFKIFGYEMLGYAGWDKGLVEWASNRHANDLEALEAITGYNTMKDYKMARYNEASSKLADIPYFDNEQIEDVICESYKIEDRNTVNHSLAAKKIITHAVKRATDEFTDGTIYEAPVNGYYKVSTAEEFMEAVAGNCQTRGIFIELTDDIDFSDVEVSTDYYMDRFFGFIQGNGHKITGLKKPLFDQLMYTVIGNAEFEGTSDVLLANNSKFTLVHHSDFDTEKTLISGITRYDEGKVVYTFFMNQ